MTVRTYRSTDAGASALTINNTAGKLIAVLDAALVNGYSVGTVSSITRVGTTATVTMSAAHGLADFGNMVTIAGCDQADYNGEFPITITGPDTFTFQVANDPVTPATGAITAAKAGSGWTKPYSDTNKAAYQQGSGSNGFYLYVDDTGTTAARAVGYETMSSITDTTGNAFPTEVQYSGGLYLPKSNGSTDREWIIVATESDIYFWINVTGTITSSALSFFGDFISEKNGDAFATVFIACTSANPISGNGVASTTPSITAAMVGHFIARTAAQTGTSVTAGKHINHVAAKAASYAGSNGLPYPTMNGVLKYCLIYIHESVIADVRGQLPGVLAPLHNRPLTHLDCFVGTGDYAGKIYVVLDCYLNGQVFIEISNTR
ncbi:MAG: hypothetical protein M8364_16605 [Methylobacter sp.]|uniref:hypothetical protein n=1 Tax=Methylobacter sp. TaxID=2051955 RepID=UPI00258FA3A6|nr:hypothetical protein [Methylobacter sp.]MCL7422513.1 hypothetical protein [Methylobacter sp.]